MIRPMRDEGYKIVVGTRISRDSVVVGRVAPHFYTERDIYYPLLKKIFAKVSEKDRRLTEVSSKLAGVEDIQCGFRTVGAVSKGTISQIGSGI